MICCHNKMHKLPLTTMVSTILKPVSTITQTIPLCLISACIMTKRFQALMPETFFWIYGAEADLNPHGCTTRPSNVRACQFRHSDMFNSTIVL